TFATGNGLLDRSAHLRDRSGDLLRRPDAVLLPLWREKVLIDIGGPRPHLGWVPPVAELLAEAADPPAFLGMTGDTPRFSAALSVLDEVPARHRPPSGAKSIALRSIAGELDARSATIPAPAQGVLGRHGTRRFGSRCGAPSGVEDGGWRRRCP